MKKNAVLILFALIAITAANAQEAMTTEIDSLQSRQKAPESDAAKQKRLKISGCIQGQYQWGQEDAGPFVKVGEKTSENPGRPLNRIGIRRGRVKLAYEHGIAGGVFQIDLTEQGVKLKDAYLNIKDPWLRSFQLRAGVFNRPFGYEIGYSSSQRESPERSTVFQTLFPDKRDLGGMLVLQAPETSPWSILKLEGGWFAGNGIKPETDNRRDFIGHLSVNKTLGNSVTLGGGVSYYYGHVFQGNEDVYSMSGGAFALNDDEANIGRYARREYFGFDVQFSIASVIGTTKLTAEYIFGQQPGNELGSESPNFSVRPETATYIRPFGGGYIMLVQELGKWPVSVVAKYDRYDPNTKTSSDQIGLAGSYTGFADIAVCTVGFGALWKASKSIRLTAYYELNYNEKSADLPGFTSDRRDNLFTLRLQYKF